MYKIEVYSVQEKLVLFFYRNKFCKKAAIADHFFIEY